MGGRLSLLPRLTPTGEEVLLQKGDYLVGSLHYHQYLLRKAFLEKQRFAKIFTFKKSRNDSGKGLATTIDQLRGTIIERNDAYKNPENNQRGTACCKIQLAEYNLELERKVEERTAELQRACKSCLKMNRNLEDKVHGTGSSS